MPHHMPGEPKGLPPRLSWAPGELPKPDPDPNRPRTPEEIAANNERLAKLKAMLKPETPAERDHRRREQQAREISQAAIARARAKPGGGVK